MFVPDRWAPTRNTGIEDRSAPGVVQRHLAVRSARRPRTTGLRSCSSTRSAQPWVLPQRQFWRALRIRILPARRSRPLKARTWSSISYQSSPPAFHGARERAGHQGRSSRSPTADHQGTPVATRRDNPRKRKAVALHHSKCEPHGGLLVGPRVSPVDAAIDVALKYEGLGDGADVADKGGDLLVVEIVDRTERGDEIERAQVELG